MDEFDIHNTKRDYERNIVKVNNSHLSKKNKELILKKDFTDATKEDIKELVRKIELNPNYSDWTKSDYRVTLKKFYQWLEGYEEGYPERVR